MRQTGSCRTERGPTARATFRRHPIDASISKGRFCRRPFLAFASVAHQLVDPDHNGGEGYTQRKRETGRVVGGAGEEPRGEVKERCTKAGQVRAAHSRGNLPARDFDETGPGGNGPLATGPAAATSFAQVAALIFSFPFAGLPRPSFTIFVENLRAGSAVISLHGISNGSSPSSAYHCCRLNQPDMKPSSVVTNNHIPTKKNGKR